jgi:hypothetical protein
MGTFSLHLRYSNLTLIRHSLFLRHHILHHGRTTFDFSDLRAHKYPDHDAEAFTEVIHWLAENCKAEQLSFPKKQLMWDSVQKELWWRGWKSDRISEKPDFERQVPWAPLECNFEIGEKHAVGFEKALWMYAYMIQLRLDEELNPTMEKMRTALFQWLGKNALKLREAELLWGLFGKISRDEELAEVGLRRFATDLPSFTGMEEGEAKKSSAFLAKLPDETRRRIKGNH